MQHRRNLSTDIIFRLIATRRPKRAKAALGARFDIRDFHDVVLKNGAVALPILEELVDDHIAAKQAA